MAPSIIRLLATFSSLATVFAAPIEKRQTVRQGINYSGVVINGSPDGTPFNYVTAQINIPDPIFVNAESGPGETQTAAAWVGYGGIVPNQQGILQTGCSVYNDGQQDTWARCWTEAFPNPPVFLDDEYGFTASIGDTVKLELTRTSDTTAHATLSNLSTGQVVDTDIQLPDGHSATGNDVEWILEDPKAKVANRFVNFQVEYFEGCGTTTAGGNNYGPGDGNFIINEYKDLGDGNGRTQWTNSYAPSETEVEVDWASQYS